MSTHSVTSIQAKTKGPVVYRVVLTGGPCGGKTTGQERLATFFERIGWKVYRVPEVASILLKGGVVFEEVQAMSQVLAFQADLMQALIAVEKVYTSLAAKSNRNCLIIHDRGAMDGSAYVDEETWKKVLERNLVNAVDLRDTRYEQVVLLETAAINAESFYESNRVRREDIQKAVELDKRTKQAWLGHPRIDIIKNKDCKSFEDKIIKLIQLVCDQAGVQIKDRLAPISKKRKFLIKTFIESQLPPVEEFEVVHHFLKPTKPDSQIRITSRGKKDGSCSYTHTSFRSNPPIETRMQLNGRQYEAFKKHVDMERRKIVLKLRCFVFDEQYYELSVYQFPEEHKNIHILETYTSNTDRNFNLPHFITLEREVTDDVRFSLFALSAK